MTTTIFDSQNADDLRYCPYYLRSTGIELSLAREREHCDSEVFFFNFLLIED